MRSEEIAQSSTGDKEMENTEEKLQDMKKRRTGQRREKTRRAVLKEVLEYFS